VPGNESVGTDQKPRLARNPCFRRNPNLGLKPVLAGNPAFAALNPIALANVTGLFGSRPFARPQGIPVEGCKDGGIKVTS